MNIKIVISFLIIILLSNGCIEQETRILKSTDEDFLETIKKSLVFLNVTSYGYEQFQPWKKSSVVQTAGFGCAVGPYEVLTTSINVIDATYINVRMSGQNEFISAKVKVVDYEANLCLLELDKEEMMEPLVPLKFKEEYIKGKEVESYWISSGGHINNARGYLDRVEVSKSATSIGKFLEYIITNTSKGSGRGRIVCINEKPIGIICWGDGDNMEAGVIPASRINQFLKLTALEKYPSFGISGFAGMQLIDPVKRRYLKMPDNMKHGFYVNKVYNLGTGCDELLEGDCILAIEGYEFDPYGRYEHDLYKQISYNNIIASADVGSDLTFDVWRDGQQKQLQVEVKNFTSDQMLVPYQEYDKQPEYIITGGYVFQKLTRSYMTIWGDDWSGKAPPHLYHYYRDLSYKPTDERKDIVILSLVLPHDISLGYHGLGRMVVSKFNGMEISEIGDILEAKKLNPESKYDVVEFEHDYPVVVIPRENLQIIDMIIARNYGINKLININ